jgi:ribose transport system permease protein
VKRVTHLLGLDRFSAIYLWAAFIVIFGIWTPSEFLTSATFHSVASSQAVAGIVAIAVLIPLACGQFDLSVGATANLAGIIATLVQLHQHYGVVEAVLFGVAVGLAIGFVNGFVVVVLGVNSFIATLGMSSILAAVQIIVTNSLQPQPVTSTGWTNLTQYSISGNQIIIGYVLVIGIVAWWFLAHTPAGRYIYATGSNEEAARLSGVRTRQWSWITLVISGGIAGLAGVLYTSLTGPSLTFGGDLLLPAFAAAFLGSTQIHPGRFNVWGTLIAIYVLATGVQGLELVSGQQWLGDMFNGVALILAVALAVSRTRRSGLSLRIRRRRGHRPGGPDGADGAPGDLNSDLAGDDRVAPKVGAG